MINALATTLADGLPSFEESGPQSLASAQVSNDSCQTAIRVPDDQFNAAEAWARTCNWYQCCRRPVGI